MTSLIRGIAAMVRKVPWLVALAGILITVALGAVNAAIDPQMATGTEGFAPDTPEIKAMERAESLFTAAGGGQAMQVVVRAAEGESVVSTAGYEVVSRITEALYAQVPDRILDDPQQPAVVSFLLPVEQAVLSGQVDPTYLQFDAGIQQVYLHALNDPSFPPEQRGYISKLINGDPAEADVGLILVFLKEQETSGEAMDVEAYLEWEKPVADVIRSQEVEGIETIPFSMSLLFEDSDDFMDEISSLMAGAGLIILVILLMVFWVKGVLPKSAGIAAIILSVVAGCVVWFSGLFSGAGGVAVSVAAGLVVYQLVRTVVGLKTRDLTLASAGRRPLADSLLTLIAIGMAIVWMQGIGAILLDSGFIGSMNEITQVVPVLLIGLGVDYGIHLTHRYREQIGSGESVDRAVSRSIGTVGIALVLATVTTAIGFLTNIFNPIPALKDFGILASVGIVAAFLLMLTFIPSVRLILDRRAEKKGRLPVNAIVSSRESVLSNVVERVSLLAERVPVVTVVAALILGCFGFWGYTKLETRFSLTDFLPADSPAVTAMEVLTDEFGGGFAETTQVLIESKDGVSLASAEVHNAMVDINGLLASVEDVLTVETEFGEFPMATSPISVLQGLLMPGPDGRTAPPELLALMGQLELGSDLKAPVGTDVSELYWMLAMLAPAEMGSVAHFDGEILDAVQFDINTQAGEAGAVALARELDSIFAAVESEEVDAIPVSTSIITGTIVNALASSQSRSLYITLATATLILMLNFWRENRRPMLGFITMLPIALVVLWTYGLMYATGIPFGPISATLAALSIGIGVPYSIHIARRFEEDRIRFDSLEDALRSTTRNTGAALAGSAFTTLAGFGILMTSSLVPFRQMGQVTSYAIGLALIGTLLVLPSLLAIWETWHRKRGHQLVEKATDSVVD